MFAIGWGFLMLAVILAAASISHDSTYIFARRIVSRLMEVPDGKVG